MNENFGELRSALVGRRYDEVARELGYLRHGSQFEVAMSYVWEHLERGLVADRPLWQSAAGAHANPLEVVLDPPQGLAWSWGGVPFVWIGSGRLAGELRDWTANLLEHAMRAWGLGGDALLRDLLAWQRLRQDPGPFFEAAEVEEALWTLRQQLKARAKRSQTEREHGVLMAAQWMSLGQAGCAAQGAARFLERASGARGPNPWGWDALGGALAERLRLGVMMGGLGADAGPAWEQSGW